MHSDRSGYWAEGQVSEFCGELINSGHATILGLASRFGLAVDDLLAAQPPGSTDTYWFLNERYTAAQADADFEPVRTAAKKDLTAAGYPTLWNNYKPAGFSLDHMSVYEWIRTRVPGGHASRFGRLLDVAYNIEYGAETAEQSSLNLLYLLAYQPSPKGFAVFGVSDEQYHIRGGNQRLPEAIAAVLPDIRLRSRLTTVVARGDGTVALSFETPEGAQQVVADQVILTLPFAVLRTLDTSRAGFDSMKRKAINELGAGRNAKLQLQFQSRVWNASGPWGISTGGSYADLGYQSTWDVSRAQGGQAGIIVNYTGGDIAAALPAVISILARRHQSESGGLRSRLSPPVRDCVPGHLGQVERPRDALRTDPRSEPPLLVLVFGRSGSIRRSPGMRACHRARSTLPASIARRTFRVLWRAALRKASARRSKSFTRSLEMADSD